MEWTVQDYGAIGELVGAAAVLVTLAFLTSQIRQSNRATKSSAYQAYLERRSNMQAMITDPQVNGMFLAGVFDPINASDEDLRGMHQMMHLCMTYFEGAHRLWCEGLLSDVDWKANLVMLSEFQATQGFRLWWPSVNDFFDPRFVRAVDCIEPTSTGIERFIAAVEQARGDTTSQTPSADGSLGCVPAAHDSLPTLIFRLEPIVD
jgi:hypothetical protein